MKFKIHIASIGSMDDERVSQCDYFFEDINVINLEKKVNVFFTRQ